MKKAVKTGQQRANENPQSRPIPYWMLMYLLVVDVAVGGEGAGGEGGGGGRHRVGRDGRRRLLRLLVVAHVAHGGAERRRP